MFLEQYNENFLLTFTKPELKRLLREMKLMSKEIGSETELNKYIRMDEMLQEASAEHPMGDLEIVIDPEAYAALYDIVWENSRKDDEDGFWLDLRHELQNGQVALAESKLPNFETLLEAAKVRSSLRIKTIVDLDEDQIAKMENVLHKYELLDMKAPKKTIRQHHPLDFSDVQHAEVWIYDIETSLPVSAYVLQQELRSILGIPEKFIVVRNENDPLEVETERLRANAEIEEEAKDSDLYVASLLSTDSEYPEEEWGIDGSEVFGDEYNSSFLKHLAQVTAARQTENYDAPNPLFSWLDASVLTTDPDTAEAAGDDFNDGYDTPKPVHRFSKDAQENNPYYGETSGEISDEGNFDDDKQTVVKFFRNKKGDQIAIDKSSEQIRKEG